jgi:hypothetical protein
MIDATILLYNPADFAESPHARWLRTHGLMVRDYQDRHNGGWERHSLNTDRFLCANRAMTQYASGETAEMAEAMYCEHYGIQWWKLERWTREAGVRVKREELPVIAGAQREMAMSSGAFEE